MVFQVEATFDIPAHSENLGNYALWLLFEYVGEAKIMPGQCQVTMNPIVSAAQVNNAPTISGTNENVEGEVAEGSGKLGDFFRRAVGFAQQNHLGQALGNVVSNFNPAVGAAISGIARATGFGAPAAKRSRGGATMGLGDFI